jgi:signal recognition particle subunit SRP68
MIPVLLKACHIDTVYLFSLRTDKFGAEHTLTLLLSPRYLYLPLVCAERSWAMAMELKQEINSDPRKKFHLLRRLKKAAKHAKHLLQLSEACERCDARTRLEAQV